MASSDDIQQEVMSLFNRLVEKLPHVEYLEVVENLASDFESRYEAAREEADAMEEGEDKCQIEVN
jgi:hypothetical protein